MNPPPSRIIYRIGPVTLTAWSADGEPCRPGDPAGAQMHQALRDFEIDPDGTSPDLLVRVRIANPATPPNDTFPVATHRAGWDVYRADGGALALKAIPYGSSPPLRSLRVDFATRAAELRVAPHDPHREYPLAYTLSELLVLMAAPWTGAVLVHSACVAKQGSAILLPGASGSGKSTMASLWRDTNAGRVLGDESHLVWMRGDQPCVAGTPWPGSSGQWTNCQTPLSAIRFLEHGNENRIREIGGAEALAVLLAQCHLPAWSTEAMERTVEVCESVVHTTPVGRFAFLPNRSAVDCLLGLDQAPSTDAIGTEIAAQMLAEGRPVRLRARGASMRPYLREGDLIEVVPVDLHDTEIGDILVVHPCGSATLIVHRLIEKRADGAILQGDASDKREGPFGADCVLGRVVSRRRNGREVRLDQGWRRTAGRLVARWGAPERIVLNTYARALGIWRGGPPVSVGARAEIENDRTVLEAAFGNADQTDNALRIAADAPRHARFLALLARRLRETGDAVPESLAEAENAAVIVSARAEALLMRVESVLSRAGLRAVAIKGAALAFGGVYQEPHLRLGADVDLICDPLHREALVRALVDAGFANAEPEYPVDYYLRYRREVALFARDEPGWPTLEVHWGASGHGYYDRRLPSPKLLAASHPGPWGESVRFLPPLFEALVEIVHMTKHLRAPHPVWALDLAMLGRAGLDWKAVEEEIARRRLQWPAYYALRWIEHRLAEAVPAGLTDRLRESLPRGRWLEARVLHARSPRGNRWIEALTLDGRGARVGYLIEHLLPHRAVMERLYPQARGRILAPFHLRRWWRLLTRG